MWSLVDGLRSDVTALVESQVGAQYSSNGHSRDPSYDSTHRGSNAPNAESDLSSKLSRRDASGVQGLNLRSREKSIGSVARPETNVSVLIRASE